MGKQLLITRGALTTFSIANDVAKYFAILPAMFAFTYANTRPARSARCPERHAPRRPAQRDHLGGHLQRPDHSGAGSARAQGRRYRAIGATALLRRNLLIYGLGGMILPFVGIKLIDLVVHNLLGA